MITPTFRSVRPWLVSALVVCAIGAPDTTEALIPRSRPAPAPQESAKKQAMQIHYLEIVTPDLDATCDALAKLHGVSFGKPDAGLGNARTAALKGGGRIGVRAPMRESEQPVVRPYVLVDDIEAATRTAEAAGGEIALPPTEIPGQGKFAIYIQGGIQHGLWQL
jgi:predicted enzyme related to lactoylglutathione lyase